MAVSLTDLISYWKGDEASGNLLDAHGTNDLTDNNTVGSAAGKIGNGRDFETGNSEFFSHASNSDLQTGNIDFTFAFWFKLESLVSMILIGKDGSGAREYAITFNAGGPQLEFQVDGGNAQVATGLNDTNWHYGIFWHDSAGDTLNIQIDNGTPVVAGTGGIFPPATASEFRIGARVFAGFEGYTDGIIDEVGYWKRVLTSDERTELYNGGAGLAYPFSAGAAGPLIRGGSLTKGALIRGGRLVA